MSIRFPIVRPVLPDLQQYQNYIDGVFNRTWLTNGGPLHQELEQRLADYLGVKHLMLVGNGTLALQIAYKALGLGKQVITTPFSFAATASSLAWQDHQCEFVDIHSKSLNIDPQLISQQQWRQLDGLVATHVFGNPCAVEEIETLAVKHNTKVIYDAAHAFGCQYKGQSLLKWGDASTLSLHATKMFHTVEGGAIIFKNEKDLLKAKQLINFGFDMKQFPEHVGINSKMSEVHAAMGLALLDNIGEIQQQRIESIECYQSQLGSMVEFQCWEEGSSNNGAYMPIILESEQQVLKVMAQLLEKGIQTRRYFYPSLSQVPCYGMAGNTPIANDISQKILCLPLYFGLAENDIAYITAALKQALAS
ncbi:DegT/DnrJ/EryC1/StrS family aminotransferase [Vibrio rotiferianus]|uniref:DegT/DnrJ/EryC1/StrS family aminotransferase n=1 Tax=Vibrio rotiferianus TaxID=190895 RepID=UPI0028938E33|nr:dTDP-4-amino-4,6-dideoxygalactose transaminase [Vibrio rotiferianus]